MNEEIDISRQFAKFLKEKRIALGLTQSEMAKLVFKDESKFQWLSKIEKGRPVTVITMNTILNNLNCTINFNEN